MQSKLSVLQAEFRKHLPQRLADIQTAWDARCASPGDSARHDEFFRLVHSLAGSAGTFGYRKLGDRARELELHLKALANEPNADAAVVVLPLLAALRDCAEQGPDKLATASIAKTEQKRDAGEEKLVYLLEDDVDLGVELARQLGNYGYRTEVFQDTGAAANALEKRTPDVWVLDVNLREGAYEGPRFAMQHWSARLDETPAIFISNDGGWDARLASVRAGGRAYLTKPLDFTALVAQLDRLTGHGDHPPYRTLIVDDTELIARHYAEVLRAGGMQVEILNDPTRLLEIIPDFKPELILMDLYMPSCNGIEAAQVIRQNPAYLNIPIVYLSTETDITQQMAALRVGADDFLKKPISDTHLLDAVTIRAERFRTLSNLMGRDSLTGLYNHITLKLALENELEHTQRAQTNTVFAMLDIDHFKSVNDRFGHPVGDAVIKSLARLLTQRLRKSDIVGRYGGEEFAVILRDTSTGQAMTLLDELRTRFADITHHYGAESFSVSFSAGLASAPPYHEMDALIDAADKALYQAKRGGRNQVMAARQDADD